MSWRIPLAETVLTEADVQAVLGCYESGWLSMGPRTQRFESALASYCGVPNAVALSSGGAALHLACRAVGVGPGDEVVVPAVASVAVAAAPIHCGAQVVLSDCTASTDPTLSIADVKRNLTPRTRAVIVVHSCGYAADVRELRRLCDEHGVALIEDMREAIGARYADESPVGSVGDVACLSFSWNRQLGIGEGGAIVTRSDGHAAAARSLRSHAMTSGTWDRHRGHSESYDILDLGYNYRLDEPRATLGLARFDRLGSEIEARRTAVGWYREQLADIDGIQLMWTREAVARSSHSAFPVMFASRERGLAIRSELRERGVETARLPALHQLPALSSHPAAGRLELARTVVERTVCLPLWAQIPEPVVDSVCAAVRSV